MSNYTALTCMPPTTRCDQQVCVSPSVVVSVCPFIGAHLCGCVVLPLFCPQIENGVDAIELISGEDSGYFRLARAGNVWTAELRSTIDYDTQETYTAQIRAVDTGGRTATSTSS